MLTNQFDILTAEGRTVIPKPHDLGSCFCPSRVFRNSFPGRNAFRVLRSLHRR
ncbi:hypothetical protein CKA32_001113 [Geitlerinema sp. FC II]|nr:hypothetical protein CKA32_001113 [Geitlerinema sp. FC II]